MDDILLQRNLRDVEQRLEDIEKWIDVHDAPDTGYTEFSSVMMHAFVLCTEFMATEEGVAELRASSPELQNILEHFYQAAKIWCEPAEGQEPHS